MFVLYCVGIPAASLYLLRTHKLEIQELQRCVYELAEKEEEERKLGGAMRTPARLSGVQEDSVREVRSESDLFADISEPPPASNTLQADIQTLRRKQKDFLEKNPRLRGLMPLYQDYEAGYYYFEVVQFIVTLFLVAVAALAFPASSRLFLHFPPQLIASRVLHSGIPARQFRLCRLFGKNPPKNLPRALFLVRTRLLWNDILCTSVCFL
jgi:hypothetical protein